LRHLRLGCLDSARSRAPGGAARERQQSDIAGALDGYTEPTLVTSANAGHAAGKNLAAFLHELGKDVGAFVVDQVHLLDTELADFLFAEELPLAAARSAGTTARAARSATFTAPTAAASWAAFAAATAATVSSTRAGPAFAARRRSRRRCLLSCRCLILFV